MKSLLFFLIIVLQLSQIYSQPGWQVQIGGVYPIDYNRDIFFLNSQTGWILQNDKIKFTSNAGTSWTNIPFKVPEDYYTRKIFFADANTGWIAGSRLLKTTNGGMNWTLLNYTINPRSIFFLNNLTGWLCGSSGLLKKTIDGGLNWSVINTGISENINNVIFLDDQTGYLAADWGKIARTANGGLNWEIYYDDVNYSFMQSIKFIDNQTGFVAATGGNIFKTTNAGVNWQKINTGNFSAFKDIIFTSTVNGYAMGIMEIYRTTNAGNSWFRSASSGLNSNTFGIEAFDNNNIWLIADSTVLYKSLDNCQSWQEKFRDIFTFASLSSIRFFDQLTGCACGEKGITLRTTNGGLNWSKMQTVTSYSLSTMYLMNQNTGYAGGGDNYLTALLLRTTDRGLTWNIAYSDTTGSISSVSFINDNTGFISGYKGLLKTTNGGFNWFRFTPFVQVVFNFRDVKFINANTGFALLNSSGFNKTTNGGANWGGLELNNATLYKIHFFNVYTGFIFGKISNSAVLFKSTNSGVNWNYEYIGPNNFSGIHFINENTGWVVGTRSDSLIKMTSNSGVNWYVQPAEINTTLSSVYFVSNNEGWACGSYGTIVHTTNGGIGITKISNEVPDNFNLYQNYPNPFNPVTIIKFSISHTSFNPEHSGQPLVQIRIFDILGREVEILVNENLKPGTYEAEWNASGFSSGIYFYILKAGENYYTAKKMVLLK